jgi:hypothetical protein
MEFEMNPVPEPLPPVDLAFPWWMDVLAWSPFLIGVAFVFLMWRKAYSSTGYISQQTAFLDHQKVASERVIQQNKAFEDLIARQYAETNRRTDDALAQSAEALRLHAAALEQLVSMNATLARVADRGIQGGAA